MRKLLQVGCGKCYLPPTEGWVNHDVFDSVQADVYADMSALPFENNTFDLIYASHVLEHCHRRMILSTLSHWKALLKPGGTLRLAVPNFESISEWYEKTRDLPALMGLLYGGQNHPKNYHTVTFDSFTLGDALRKVGFVNVRRWNWRETEHGQYDDYSQAYLPAMQKETGMLMSLNMQADKE